MRLLHNSVFGLKLAALENDLPQALKLIDSAIAAAPNNAQALVVKAGFENAQGRRGEAIKTLERAVEVSGGSLGARYALASMLIESGQLDNAAVQVDAMKKMSPLEWAAVPPIRPTPKPARCASRSHWCGSNGASVATIPMIEPDSSPSRGSGIRSPISRPTGTPSTRKRSRRP